MRDLLEWSATLTRVSLGKRVKPGPTGIRCKIDVRMNGNVNTLDEQFRLNAAAHPA
jgi:hypothetical protein